MKKLYLTLLLALTLLLCGCEKIIPQPEPTETEPPVEQVSVIVSAEELALFDEQYPALREADLTGSTCYDAIEAYIASHPQVTVRYTVTLGDTEVSPDVQTLTLEPGTFDYGVLRANLRYLHALKYLTFQNNTLMIQTIQDLKNTYPGLDICFNLQFCGVTIDGEAEDLDLSAIDPEEAISQAERLVVLPNLTEIYLTDGEGKSPYSLEEAAQLQEKLPEVLLHYSFTLFDKPVSTMDEEIVFVNRNIAGIEGSLNTIRQALTVLRGCKRFVLDNCKFSNEVMAELREEFRGQTKVVWRIWFGEGGILTDRDVIRHVYGLYDYNCENLIYCEDAEFIDFGHNELLRRCDYVAGMPHLKAIILSGSMVADLSAFANCRELEFLELAFCGYLEDLSPLANCPNLQRLNIAFTKVDDLSALDEIPVEVLVDARSHTDTEDWGRFEALHPDCIVQHTGDAKDDQPYNYPWRYEHDGSANPYYALLKEKFHYPNTYNTLY